MAAIAGIELDVAVIGAKMSPHTPYGADGGVVGATHIHVAFVQQAVHAFIGAEGRKGRRIMLVAVLAAPGHIEHGFAVLVACIYRVDKPLGIREAFLLNLGLGEGWQLALFLQHHNVPASFSYQVHRMVGAVLLECTTTRGVALVFHPVACALGCALYK